MLDRSLHREGGHRAMEPLEGNTADPSRSDPVFTKLERIATLAVLDVDVRKYSDRIDHARLREFLRRRVRDGVLSLVPGESMV